MATCATLGEAVGVIVFQAVKNGMISPRSVCRDHIREIQDTLLDDDCWIPGKTRTIPEICRTTQLTADSGDAENLRTWADRELDGKSNGWTCHVGSCAQYDFSKETELHRIVFDSKLSRNHLNMVANYWMNESHYEPPGTLMERFHIEADGKEIFRCNKNHQRLIRIPVSVRCTRLKLVIDAVRGECCKVFAFEAE